MRRNTAQKQKMAAIWENCTAEDNVLKHLDKRPGRALVAVVAANCPLRNWGYELSHMIERNDPREVLITTPSDVVELQRRLNEAIDEDVPDLAAVNKVITMLEHLTPDAAAWVAYSVARFELRHELGITIRTTI